MDKVLYQYNATVLKVYDGDTITLEVDLGFGIKIKHKRVRLARINAKEIRGVERPDGLEARQWLANQILGKEIIFTSIKDRTEKYGRYLAEIWLKSGNGYININDRMVEENYAEHLSI